MLTLLSVPTTSAHAAFSTSAPPPDSQVEVGLTHIEVTLTEDVILEFSGLEVTDLRSETWHEGSIQHGAAKNVLVASTRPLQDGIYVVSWKALSVDTHTTRGQFLFAAGNATLTTRSGSQTDTVQEPGGGVRDAVARGAYYAGLLMALGTPLFFLLVDRRRDAPHLALLLAGGSGILGSLGALVNLHGLAQRADVTIGQIAPTEGGIHLTLRALFLAASGGVLLLAAIRRGRTRRALLGAGVLFASAALASTSLGSHAASVSDHRTLAIASDATHLLAAAVWVGGVAAFLFALRGASAADAAGLLSRFSPIAMTSVALILLTGTYESFRFVKTLDSLWSEPYGRIILLKVGLVILLIGFGALHQRVLHPRLTRATFSANGFRKVLALEAALMLVVVGAAGTLATTSPPQERVEVDRTPLVLELQNHTEKTHVILQISPNPITIGVHTIRVYLHPLTAVPIPNSTIVQLKIWGPGEAEPESTITPEKTALGEWTTRGGYFTSVGTWNVEVLYQRSDEGFHTFTYEVPVTSPSQPPQASP